MIELLDTVIDFNETVLRNAPVANLADNSFNPFDDLSNDKQSWKKAEELSTDNTIFSINKSEAQYQAIEYVFACKEIKPSRFGNGEFPVWYGALKLDTTFHETNFHWRQTLLADAGFLNTNSPIYMIRTVFEINCASTLIDLRLKTKAHTFLVDPDRNHYQKTQDIGLKLSNEGFPGLLTLSARATSGVNVVVFNKKILHHPRYQNDYLYEILPDDPKVTKVRYYRSRRMVTEIS